MFPPGKSLDSSHQTSFLPQNEVMWRPAVQEYPYSDEEQQAAAATGGGGGDADTCLCRICLCSDDPADLIAPCLCKGTSKWVHRVCLDEWRIHEPDRAFFHCTECQFLYHLEETTNHQLLPLRARFCWFVSRDLCLVTVAVQLVIIALGWLVQVIDKAHGNVLLQVFLGSSGGCSSSSSSTSSSNCHGAELAVYYTYGFLCLLVLLGIFGSGFLCSNNCQIPDLDSVNNNTTVPAGNMYTSHEDDGATTTTPLPHTYSTNAPQHRPAVASPLLYNRRADFYRNRRRQRSQPSATNNNCGEACCMPRYGYYPQYYAPYYGPTGDTCCCCCPGVGSSSSSSNNDCCDLHDGCCPLLGQGHHGGNNSSGDNAPHILLILLLIAVIIMAMIGLFVGIFLAVVVGQRIVQRHMLLLEKQRLVDDFVIKDLSPYDLTATTTTTTTAMAPEHDVAVAADSIYYAPSLQPPPTMATTNTTTSGTIYNAIPVPPPPPRSMRPDEAAHLRKLGLLD